MSITQFQVTESHGIARNNEVHSLSIPLPQGLLRTDLGLRLFDESTASLDFNAKALNYWPDNSVKWLKVVFVISLAANEQKEVFLALADTQVTPQPIKTKLFAKGCNFSLLAFNSSKQLTKLKGVFEAKVNKHKYKAIVDSCEEKAPSQFGNMLSSEFNVVGHFQDHTNQALNLRYKAEFNVNWSLQKIETQLCILNPEAALHPGGIWDLGDENSIHLESLLLEFDCDTFSQLQINDAESRSEYTHLLESPVNIKQLNSGGEHFDCINHVDKDNNVDVGAKGYSMMLGEKLVAGHRLSPTLLFNGKLNHAITLINFWQNFPKALEVNDKNCRVYIFPTAIELQAGEQKTHSMVQAFGEQAPLLKNVHKPLATSLAPEWIAECEVLPFFTPNLKGHPLIALLQEEALENANNFMAKREKIDEFGWRNFGELYADHETSRYEGDTPFISHYNNQYDPIFGFINQYFLSADKRWLELANDLAKHVIDIDIYHTDKDKTDYNHGLFWHTDHYNQAYTCTHRTFSKHQHQATYGNQSDGGGPGGQHCYTTGLALHYCLTGNESSKQAVLELTQWITNIYEGSGSIFEFALRLRKDEHSGHKNMVTNTYPLDRGTGHYVIALVDSFYLTNDIGYLQRAQEVIQHTISADDNIDDRALDNPEKTWFYVVFLQSVARFLQQNGKLSTPLECSHVVQAFEKYINWMLANEKPFLESSDKLEFVNATWIAQDLRKSWLFDACLSISCLHNKRELLAERSAFFKDYVYKQLKNSPEKHYSRILSLVMQNLSAISRLNNYNEQVEENESKQLVIFKRKTLANNLCLLIKHFSLRREIVWLKSRLR